MDLTANLPVSATAPFSFPILKAPDILQCLQELTLELTETELNEPHRYKDKIRKVFSVLLESCTGKTEKDFEPSSAAAKAKIANLTMSHPELYPDSCWTEAKFFAHLRKCMDTCGIHDFSLRDLHSPTSKRLGCQLSAFINFIKFREDQLHFYMELQAPRAKLFSKLEDLKNEHNDLLTQLEEAKLAKFQLHHEREQVIKECEELEIEIAHYNQRQRSQREDHNELKRQATDLQDQLRAATWELQEVQSEEEQLRAAVVSSPERRLAQLEQAQERLDRHTKECEMLKEKLEQTEVRKAELGEAIQMVDDSYQLAKEVHKMGRQYQQASEQVTSLQAQVDEIKLQLQQRREQVAQSQQLLLDTKNALSNWRRSSQKELQDLQQTVTTRQEELAAAEQDRLADLARIQEGNDEVQRLEHQMQQERNQMEGELQQVVQQFQLVEQAFMKRNAKRVHHHQQQKEVKSSSNSNNNNDENTNNSNTVGAPP